MQRPGRFSRIDALNRDQLLREDTTRGLRENGMHESVDRRIAANHQGDEAHDRGTDRWCREERSHSITKIPTQRVQHRRVQNYGRGESRWNVTEVSGASTPALSRLT